MSKNRELISNLVGALDTEGTKAIGKWHFLGVRCTRPQRAQRRGQTGLVNNKRCYVRCASTPALTIARTRLHCRWHRRGQAKNASLTAHILGLRLCAPVGSRVTARLVSLCQFEAIVSQALKNYLKFKKSALFLFIGSGRRLLGRLGLRPWRLFRHVSGGLVAAVPGLAPRSLWLYLKLLRLLRWGLLVFLFRPGSVPSAARLSRPRRCTCRNGRRRRYPPRSLRR